MRLVAPLLGLVCSAALASEPIASVRLSALPPDISAALQELCSGCKFADSDAAWQSTDVGDGTLPQRRLVGVEHHADEWIVTYQHGGRGLHKHVVRFLASPTVHIVSTNSCLPSPTCREW